MINPRLAGLVVIAAALGCACSAGGSVYVGADAENPTLQVNAKGTAVVTFTSNGKRDVVSVPLTGLLYHGGFAAGGDVSKPAPAVSVPLGSTVVRRTPDGTFWVLQEWRVLPGHAVELHLSRWRGTQPVLTLATDGRRLTGTAFYSGKPMTGTSTTLEGRHPRIFVYLDCFKCGGKPGWTRMIGVSPRADGSFAVYLRPAWNGKRFRATVEGVNRGGTFAPDAQTEIAA